MLARNLLTPSKSELQLQCQANTALMGDKPSQSNFPALDGLPAFTSWQAQATKNSRRCVCLILISKAA